MDEQTDKLVGQWTGPNSKVVAKNNLIVKDFL